MLERSNFLVLGRGGDTGFEGEDKVESQTEWQTLGDGEADGWAMGDGRWAMGNGRHDA